MSKSRLIILVLAILLIAGTATYAFASSSKETANPSIEIDMTNKAAAAAPGIASVYYNAKVKYVDSPDYVRASAYVLKSDGNSAWFWISNNVSTTTQLEIYNAFVLGKITQSNITVYTDSSGYVNRVTVL